MSKDIKVLGHIDIKASNSSTSKKSNNRLTKDQLPKDCWVLENQKYFYNDKNYRYLPYVFANNKQVLDMLEVPYYEDTLGGKEILSFENPDSQLEYENHSAPIYYKAPNGYYVPAQKKHTGIIFTDATVQALAYIKQKVLSAIKEYTIFCKAQEVLDGHLTGVMLSNHKARKTIDLAGENVQGYSLRVGEEDYLTVFFDLNKIKKLEKETSGKGKINIILDLPAELNKYSQKISGNLGLWAAEMGLGYIHIRDMEKVPWYKR